MKHKGTRSSRHKRRRGRGGDVGALEVRNMNCERIGSSKHK